MQSLTEYQREKFDQIQTLVEYKWYRLNPDRPDYEEFVNCLKLYIDSMRTLEFNGTMTHFRRVRSFSELKNGSTDEYVRNMPAINEHHNISKWLPSKYAGKK